MKCEQLRACSLRPRSFFAMSPPLDTLTCLANASLACPALLALVGLSATDAEQCVRRDPEGLGVGGGLGRSGGVLGGLWGLGLRYMRLLCKKYHVTIIAAIHQPRQEAQTAFEGRPETRQRRRLPCFSTTCFCSRRILGK